MKTNILVQYRGGEYNGCSWEWNYFYIDKQGEFHNIFSSGSAGIEDIIGAEGLIRHGKDMYIYDMSKEKDILSFIKESNAVNITGVLQWFEDNPNIDVEFFVICSACGKKIMTYDDIVLENWHGCGGIESTADTLLCQECYMVGHCNCCESYVGDTEIVKVNPDEHYGFDYICAGCKEYHDDEREVEQFEDLRFQSFCTGTPDMFSGELREHRIQPGTYGGL